MKLLRRYYEGRTEGKLIFPDDSHLYTLERPDLNNKPYVSCIPEGKYLIDRDHHGNHQWYKVREGQVKGRSAIEIHPANKVEQLAGCIAPAMYLENGQARESTKACKELLFWFGEASFWLEIRKYNPFKDGKW